MQCGVRLRRGCEEVEKVEKVVVVVKVVDVGRVIRVIGVDEINSFFRTLPTLGLQNQSQFSSRS